MKLRIMFIISLIFIVNLECFSQKDYNDAFTNTIIPKLKYEYGNYNSLSLSFGLGKGNVYDIAIYDYKGLFLDFGVTRYEKTNFLTSKIGAEFYAMFFVARLSVLNQTNFIDNQYLIRPEVGFTLFTVFSVLYGYNFNIYNTYNNYNFSGSVLTIDVAYFIKYKRYRKNKIINLSCI